MVRLQHPIVLIHGLGAKSRYGPLDYFHGLLPLLREAGNVVLVADLKFWHTIEHRSGQLQRQIEEKFPASSGKKFNLIGHSMGGLDARYLTSCTGLGERVTSVTTVGTPNRGTSLADMALDLVSERGHAVADRLSGFLNWNNGGFRQMGKKYHSETFSSLAPNKSGVAYFSASSAIADPVVKNALPIFWFTHGLLKKKEGDNDGFVSVDSARWGEHICTWSGDHYAQIGQFPGRSRGLDYLEFFSEILERLKTEGF